MPPFCRYAHVAVSWGNRMARSFHAFAIVWLLFGLIDTTLAQKRGGILTMTSTDSPGGLSVLEEATYFSTSPMAGGFNNLIIFDQQEKQNRLDTIVPHLATTWSWSSDRLGPP